jgi:hypothetical protein
MQGRDILLFVEGKTDKTAYERLFEKCGYGALLKRVRFEESDGYGMIEKLIAAATVLRNVADRRIRIAAIRDSDYSESGSSGEFTESGGVLILRLPCKELENLLLLSVETIYAACKAQTEEKKTRYPDKLYKELDRATLSKKIDEISGNEENKEKMRMQWIGAKLHKHASKGDMPGLLIRYNTEYDEIWKKSEWRLRHSSGKYVLKKLREWLTTEYNVSISTTAIMKRYEPTHEFGEAFRAFVAAITSSE